MNSNFYFTLAFWIYKIDRCLFLTSLCSFMALYRVDRCLLGLVGGLYVFNFVELFYRFSNYCVFGALCKYFITYHCFTLNNLVQHLSTQFCQLIEPNSLLAIFNNFIYTLLVLQHAYGLLSIFIFRHFEHLDVFGPVDIFS